MPVAFEIESQQVAEARLVLDDEDAGRSGAGHGRHRSRRPIKET
jgi:hypothetical protein